MPKDQTGKDLKAGDSIIATLQHASIVGKVIGFTSSSLRDEKGQPLSPPQVQVLINFPLVPPLDIAVGILKLAPEPEERIHLA